jgi:hypothetical protein
MIMFEKDFDTERAYQNEQQTTNHMTMPAQSGCRPEFLSLVAILFLFFETFSALQI